MKLAFVAAAAVLAFSLPVMAQSNATTQGTSSAPGNSSGIPAAATPAGQVGSTGGAPAPGTSAFRAPGQTAPAPTADSTTTGTTAVPAK